MHKINSSIFPFFSKVQKKLLMFAMIKFAVWTVTLLTQTL